MSDDNDMKKELERSLVLTKYTMDYSSRTPIVVVVIRLLT